MEQGYEDVPGLLELIIEDEDGLTPPNDLQDQLHVCVEHLLIGVPHRVSQIQLGHNRHTSQSGALGIGLRLNCLAWLQPHHKLVLWHILPSKHLAGTWLLLKLDVDLALTLINP